jgi:DNA-binding transcriptional ArsR family regulator
MALGTPALVAMASPRRREILRLIWTRELAAGAISAAMPDVTFGAVSGHLSALRDAGLVDARAEGQFRFYRARRDAFGAVGRELERVWHDALFRLKVHAELEHARRGPRGRRRASPGLKPRGFITVRSRKGRTTS